jgi:hypothetical protein
MSVGACTEQDSQHSECVFQKALHYEQILSCGRSKDSEILEARTLLKTGTASSASDESNPALPVHFLPSPGNKNKVPASGLAMPLITTVSYK